LGFGHAVTLVVCQWVATTAAQEEEGEGGDSDGGGESKRGDREMANAALFMSFGGATRGDGVVLRFNRNDATATVLFSSKPNSTAAPVDVAVSQLCAVEEVPPYSMSLTRALLRTLQLLARIDPVPGGGVLDDAKVRGDGVGLSVPLGATTEADLSSLWRSQLRAYAIVAMLRTLQNVSMIGCCAVFVVIVIIIVHRCCRTL
jgi:hypothetical protein